MDRRIAHRPPRYRQAPCTGCVVCEWTRKSGQRRGPGFVFCANLLAGNNPVAEIVTEGQDTPRQATLLIRQHFCAPVGFEIIVPQPQVNLILEESRRFGLDNYWCRSTTGQSALCASRDRADKIEKDRRHDEHPDERRTLPELVANVMPGDERANPLCRRH